MTQTEEKITFEQMPQLLAELKGAITSINDKLDTLLENGTIATQEEVFAAFDTAFNAGLKNYDRLLNQTKDADPKTNGKIFDTLKNLCLSYAAGEIDAK